MRAQISKFVLLSGLLIPGWTSYAHAQGVLRDGPDLPCNDFCQSWMGPAYVEPSSPSRAEPQASRVEMSPEARDQLPKPDAPMHVVHRFAARGRVWLRAERHEAEPIESKELAVPSFRLRPILTTASRPLPSVRKIMPAVASVARLEPVKTANLHLDETITTIPQTMNTPATVGEPSARLDNDTKTLTLSLNGTPAQEIRLTAPEADRLVEMIGAARAKMQPQAQQNWAFGQNVSTIYDPRWTTEAERGKGNTLLHIRDPRYGWLHYTVPRMTAQQLGTLLQKQAGLPIPAAHRAEATP